MMHRWKAFGGSLRNSQERRLIERINWTLRSLVREPQRNARLISRVDSNGDDRSHECFARAQGRANGISYYQRIQGFATNRYLPTEIPDVMKGNQSRPRIFDLSINKPDVLYQTVLEVDERVTLEGYAEDPEPKEIKVPDDHGASGLVKGVSGEVVRILKKPNLKEVQDGLQKLYDDGYRSIAICFMHSYTFPGICNSLDNINFRS